MLLNTTRVPLFKEIYVRGTSTRCVLKLHLALRKRNLASIMIIIILTYMVLEHSEFFSIKERNDFTVDYRNNRHRMRRPLCPTVEYPKLNFGPNRTSAYHNPNEPFLGEDDVISSEKYSNYSDFKLLLQSHISRRLIHFGDLPINAIFVGQPYYDIPHPACNGLWLEFGVFQGESISKTAFWKMNHCGNSSPPVYGFDSFDGLPVDWRPGYGRGHFNLSGNILTNLLPNIRLVKGWFINSLPVFLQTIDRDNHACSLPVTYLHVDSDLYDSARDIFYLLGNRLRPGSIIIFDELTNYPSYDKHEMKVLFEYVSSHPDFQLRVIGAATPMHLNPPHDIFYQSVAFLVV